MLRVANIRIATADVCEWLLRKICVKDQVGQESCVCCTTGMAALDVCQLGKAMANFNVSSGCT